jgi:hypothetical protein
MRWLAALLIFMLLPGCATRQGSDAENTVAGLSQSAAPAPIALDLRTACLLSQMAYCEEPQAKLDSFMPGWKLVWHPARANSNHAFVATDGHQWAVAFRGSLMDISWEALDNWINQDLNILTQVKWPYSSNPDARISQGAHNAFQNLLALKDTVAGNNLLSFLKENVPAGSRLLLTGHSLGGSLASVFASYLHQEMGNQRPEILLTSFAAPAFANKEFVVEFDKLFPRAVRVESRGDLVTRFPNAARVKEFAANCSPLPPADSVVVSYKGVQVNLREAMEMMAFAMSLLELSQGSAYHQIAASGRVVDIEPTQEPALSGVDAWFAAARYQHGIAQYASSLNVPLVACP